MKRLFWGFFFILFDFSVPLAPSPFGTWDASLNLLPDFVGFGLLVSASMRLAGESPLFHPVHQWSIGLCIYSALAWFCNIFFPSLSPLFSLLNVAALILELDVAWLVIEAIANVEMRRNAELGSIPLRAAWKALAICAVLSLVLLSPVFFPLAGDSVVAVCLTVALFLAGLFFLVRLWRVGKEYEEVVAFQNNR